MRRTLTVLLAATGLLVGVSEAASAEKVTLDGQGNITKMVANNADKKIVTKVYGLDEPCMAKSLWVTVSSRQDAQYRAEAGCYQGTWITGLYLSKDGDWGSGGKEVDCDGFVFNYNADHGFYKVVMPRSCVGKLPDKVRVSSEGVDYDSATPGSAGPTKLLGRG